MITDGLVLDYRGTAKDWSRYHHTITNNNAVPVRGIKGDAFFFNGTNAYLDCGNDASLNITDAITIEAWVNTSEPTKIYQMIVTRSDGTANAQYEFAFYADYGKLGFASRIGGGFNWYGANTVLLANTWYHAVVTFNGTQIKWYLNGVDDGTVSISGSMNGQAQAVLIGDRVPGDEYSFSGTIDEVRIYNRALSAYEIWTHYNALKPYIPLKEMPVAIV